MAVIIDGTALSKKVKEQVRLETEVLVQKYNITPHLVVILVGHNPASESYVRGKERACIKTGILSTVIKREGNVTNQEMLDLINELNTDNSVHGILLQLPIPSHLDSELIISSISPMKDVDGFTPVNVAKLANGNGELIPCTPKGIMKMLDEYQIDITGKQCTVLGRSQIVGKPIANLLLKANGTVTICHSKTKNLSAVASMADILVVAIGKPKMVDDTYVKSGAVVIDVGISKVDDILCGDVDFEKASKKAGFITPVPGGVGPMTIACLLENTLLCFKKIVGESK